MKHFRLSTSVCAFRKATFHLLAGLFVRCCSFEDVVLLIPATVTEREPIKGNSKVYIVECIDERIHGLRTKEISVRKAQKAWW